MLARRASISATYLGVDISPDINKDLISFSYTDNAHSRSDNITIILKDKNMVWSKDWFTEKGDKIKAFINTLNWRSERDNRRLDCGEFIVDEPEISGPPNQITIGAVSAPLNSNFKDVEKNRVWRAVKISTIFNEIASSNGLTLETYMEEDPVIQSIEQSEESDSSFIKELCEKEGLAIKITNSKMIIFDEKIFEQRDSVATYTRGEDSIIGYSFKGKISNTSYDGVRIKYYDSDLARNIDYLYKISDGEKIFEINEVVHDENMARRRTQKKLRDLNKRETTGMLFVTGNTDLVGAACINVEGFGVFDGKYFIISAGHTLPGYQTSLEIRKVLEGY